MYIIINLIHNSIQLCIILLTQCMLHIDPFKKQKNKKKRVTAKTFKCIHAGFI